MQSQREEMKNCEEWEVKRKKKKLELNRFHYNMRHESIYFCIQRANGFIMDFSIDSTRKRYRLRSSLYEIECKEIDLWIMTATLTDEEMCVQCNRNLFPVWINIDGEIYIFACSINAQDQSHLWIKWMEIGFACTKPHQLIVYT